MKPFSPSVRLGFAVVPSPLIEPVLAIRQLIDWHPPLAMQIALTGFIEDGLLDKHIRRRRRVYADRHRIVTAALAGPLAGQLSALPSNAGLHVAAMLRDGLGERQVLRVVARHGIAMSGLLDCFHAGPARAGLMIGFGAVSTAELPAALRVLDRALTSC